MNERSYHEAYKVEMTYISKLSCKHANLIHTSDREQGIFDFHQPTGSFKKALHCGVGTEKRTPYLPATESRRSHCIIEIGVFLVPVSAPRLV